MSGSLNIEAIKRLNISDVDICENSISILWIAAANRSNRESLTFRFHTHTFFEIHFIIEGQIRYGFENENVIVKKGQFILTAPLQAHSVASHSDDFTKITIAFEADEESDIFNILSSNKKQIFSISKEIKDDLDFILSRAKNKSNYSEILIKKRLGEIIYLIADSMPHTKTVPVKSKYSDDRILQAKKYIYDNPNIFFTTSEIALFCGISPKQLGRLFEKYEGKTVLEFIHEQKIEIAKQLLLESDELQETISKKLGFSSVHYFNKFFISHTGITPSKYRKMASSAN
ncbi:MAG: AraC family transcriptional regulator [Ruminococcaceae bacterium]|nr:AraC family transcriptional regulator [Oscillospiraceae bacterium]